MRISTLLFLTSLVACGGDDAEDTANTLGSDPSSESTAGMSATAPSESSSDDTLTTTMPGSESESGGSESGGSESGGSETSAGPADSSGSESGDTGDVSVCQQYCDAYAANCTENGTQYADEDACLAACAVWPAGTPEDTAGNTQGCHLYHVNAAADDPVLHCPHAQEVPDGGCV